VCCRKKQKSAAPGVLIGQRHRSSLSSSSEQQCPLAIGSSSAAASGSAYTAWSIRYCSLGSRAAAASLFGASFRAGRGGIGAFFRGSD